MAEWAREHLPPAPDTLRALGIARTTPIPGRAESSRRPRRRQSRVVTGIGVVVILAGTAFLVGSRADVDEPTATPVTAIAEPQPHAARTAASRSVNKSATRTPSPRRSSGVANRTRRFAWPPVVGATGYHVELFKRSALIFRDETRKSEILIRRRWRFNGRLRRLEPGAYRWYVWPLVGRQRIAKAVVQAQLVIPR
jgi:hypothetical protein